MPSWTPNPIFGSGYNVNVMWQDTTSNATYCSAKSALAIT